MSESEAKFVVGLALVVLGVLLLYDATRLC